MLENNPAEHRIGPGPIFIVEAVGNFRTEHPTLQWLLEPCDVPAGRYAAYAEPGGTAIRILDLTGHLGDHDALFTSPR